jgi:hypothetical protein
MLCETDWNAKLNGAVLTWAIVSGKKKKKNPLNSTIAGSTRSSLSISLKDRRVESAIYLERGGYNQFHRIYPVP